MASALQHWKYHGGRKIWHREKSFGCSYLLPCKQTLLAGNKCPQCFVSSFRVREKYLMNLWWTSEFCCNFGSCFGSAHPATKIFGWADLGKILLQVLIKCFLGTRSNLFRRNLGRKVSFWQLCKEDPAGAQCDHQGSAEISELFSMRDF